jgi:acetyl-CoA C-acetyltransferase
MNDVIIAGIGQTPVGEHWDISLRDLAVQAIRLALKDSGGLKPQTLFAANSLAPNLSRQANLGTLLADYAGLGGIEATAFELGGASGGAALRQAALAIESGFIDVALVIGVEKFTDTIAPAHETAASTQADSEYESVHGLTPAAQAGLLTQRYWHEFNLSTDCLAGFPITAHANAVGNKHAFFRKALSLEQYHKADVDTDTLNTYDIAPYVDGAAALVLTRSDLLPVQYPHVRVRLAASSSVSDSLALHNRPDLLSFTAARQSVDTALSSAGVTREQVDLFEYSDAFSIFAALSLEAAGYARRGQGWTLASEEGIARTGQIPCATMGGLKARGNPLGATGIYQAVEAVLQLRGQAGACQVEGARTAMIQCLSGPASAAVTHILGRIDKE